MQRRGAQRSKRGTGWRRSAAFRAGGRHHPESSGVRVAGYERARNLEAVLRLVDQGLSSIEDGPGSGRRPRAAFEQAIELDSLWQAAHAGLQRVQDDAHETGVRYRA